MTLKQIKEIMEKKQLTAGTNSVSEISVRKDAFKKFKVNTGGFMPNSEENKILKEAENAVHI